MAKLLRMAADTGAYLTATGRLRSNARFGACRNGPFQSIAADGCLAALWRLFREGFDVRAMVHDEIIVATPDTGHFTEVVADVERIMREEMSNMLGGLPIKTEAFVRRSLSPRDAVPLEAEELPPADFFWEPQATPAQAEPADAAAEDQAGEFLSFTMGQGRRTKQQDPGPGVIRFRSRKGRPKALPGDLDDIPF